MFIILPLSIKLVWVWQHGKLQIEELIFWMAFFHRSLEFLSYSNPWNFFIKKYDFSISNFAKFCFSSTQCGKGSSEGKKVQQSRTLKLNKGMFKWFKFVKIKRIHEAILECWWYTGRIVHQLWAEWAVHVNCYLQNGFMNFFVFCNFKSI